MREELIVNAWKEPRRGCRRENAVELSKVSKKCISNWVANAQCPTPKALSRQN